MLGRKGRGAVGVLTGLWVSVTSTGGDGRGVFGRALRGETRHSRKASIM